uniref:Coatomer subunit alpha-1-like n=1 Tax=Tanacetum cinerariifolium TaxID=118510 RepID=A0A699KFJ4_TANCI|nr:coatomer subunit alpha-1-like [Tanacetum cinerariifolium]
MIAYLQQKGFPEVALHFVKDERSRFNLALESGNIQIDEKDHWYRLGIEALRQGNAGIVEFAYQRMKSFDRLSFLYMITGNLDKLSKMMKIADVKNNVMGQFHNALYLGDVQERIKILVNAGHLPLAYTTAMTHGLNDIAKKLKGSVPYLPIRRSASFLIPPTPVLHGGDWPLLRVVKGIFEGGLDNAGKGANEDYDDAVDAHWGEDLDIVDDEEAPEENEDRAAGNFDTAMQLLSDQLATRNLTPLKSLFIDLNMGSHTYLCAFPSAPLLTFPIEKGWSESARPALVFNFSQLKEKLKAGMKATTTGKFTEALGLFRGILHTIPLTVVESIEEVDEVKEMIITVKDVKLCKEALRDQMQKARAVMQAAEKNMTDKMQVNYDFRNPFVVCGATYIPIYRSQRDVLCPYCTSLFVLSQEGQLCTVCDLAVVRSDASGLLCSPSQIG